MMLLSLFVCFCAFFYVKVTADNVSRPTMVTVDLDLAVSIVRTVAVVCTVSGIDPVKC